MKREVVLFSILILLFAIFPFVFAADPPEINNAYTCLNEKINSSSCAGLSFEEKIFSSLATGKCTGEISNASSQGECWPSSNCNVKQTAQALLALENYDEDYNTTKGEEWLLSQKTIPTELQWLLEIESNEATTCSIYYQGNEAGLSLTIGEDKKISSSNLGNCFALSTGNYFLEISPECYNMDLDISCDKGFLTTLLFKKQGSSTINVLDESQEASAKGFVTEKVSSWCFSNPQSNSCDYEGSLWASEILFYFDRDVSPFLPYLIAFSEENSEYLPESFLYYLTGEYRNELLSKQVANKYWIVSGDEYYDTALALLPLQYESPLQKTNSKNWLLDRQEESGCWDNGNLRNTAFILYSVWPRNIGDEPVEETVCGDGVIEGDEECEGTNLDGESCESLGFSEDSGDLDCYAPGTSRECEFDESECIVPTECDEDHPCPEGYECSTGGQCLEISEPDYECETDDDCKDDEICSSSHICVEETLDCEPDYGYCMSAIDCDGSILKEYDCSGLSKCCSVDKTYGTCRSQGGEICDTDDETCDGYKIDADNLLSDEICCMGDCEEKGNGGGDNEYLCEDNDGTCRTSCLRDERESSFYDCDLGDVCCLEDKKEGSNWFIWLLVALILLVVLGIVFRDKLREIFMRLKTKFKKGKGSGKGLKHLFLPKTPPSGPGQRMPPRRIIPPSQRPNPPRTPPQKTKKSTASKELDDVLKKLRDLGNK